MGQFGGSQLVLRDSGTNSMAAATESLGQDFGIPNINGFATDQPHFANHLQQIGDDVQHDFEQIPLTSERHNLPQNTGRATLVSENNVLTQDYQEMLGKSEKD